jgi:PAS domain S-box-containing protein
MEPSGLNRVGVPLIVQVSLLLFWGAGPAFARAHEMVDLNRWKESEDVLFGNIWFQSGIAIVVIGAVVWGLWRLRSYELRRTRRQLATERELADMMRKRDEHWRLALEVARIETWDWNLATNEVTGSPGLQQMFAGPDVRELGLEREYHDFIHPDDSARVKAGIEAAIRDGRRYHEDFRVVWLDGSIHWIEGRGEVFPGLDGKPTRLVGISLDITERRKAESDRRAMEAKFQETQKLESLGVLAGGVAHDFNNLLTAMLGNVGLVKSGLATGSPHLPLIEDIERAALRAGDLCSQMLAYSGRGRFVVKPVEVSGLIREIVQMMKVSIAKSVDLRFELAENLLPVMADVAQMNQVIMNLVLNAAEALGERPGEIVLSTEALEIDDAYLERHRLVDQLSAGPHVRIVVRDNGPGMGEETLRRIFEPFFTTKFTGRGLGLAAVQGIVRGHHGVMEVTSEPRRGTSFSLLLPALKERLPESDVSKIDSFPSGIVASNGGASTVLVVDDEAIVRDTTTTVLKRFGYSVVSAGDGEEGVKLFGELQEQLSAVLLDLAMPRMDGVEAFKRIRRLRPGIPVLLMSGYSEAVAIQRFDGAGLDGFLQKPFTNEALLKKLRAVVGEKRI